MNKKRILALLVAATVLAATTTPLLNPATTTTHQTQPTPTITRNPTTPPPQTQWNRTYGGTSYDWAYSVQQTADGGYIVAGGTCSFSLGIRQDFWLVKTDSSSNKQWSKAYGGGGWEAAYSVQQTADGGYIVAGYAQPHGGSLDFWLVKTNSTGYQQWNKTYGGVTSSEEAFSVQQTADGGYILAGYTTPHLTVNRDFWVVKTDSTGYQQWNKTYGGPNEDEAQSVQQTADGGYIVAGTTNSSGAGGYDFWLVKTASGGNQQWNKTYGGTNNDEAYSVQQTSDGGYIVAGGTLNGVMPRPPLGGGGDSVIVPWDFWLVKTDPGGNQQWNKTYGGTNEDQAYSVQQTTDGGYIVAGTTWSFGAGEGDYWLVKTDSAGNHQWNKTYGGTSDERAYSVQQTSDGGYIVAGWTWSFGAGLEDFWLVKTGRETGGGVGQGTLLIVVVGGVAVAAVVVVIAAEVIIEKRRSSAATKRARAP